MATGKYSFYTAAALLLVNSFFTGCSKDKDEPGTNGKKAKVVVSVSSGFKKAEGDDFMLQVGGGNPDGSFVDWKVDGTTEKGTVITVGSDYVNGGKTNVTLESIQGFSKGSVIISSYNISGVPYTVTYRIELDGKVVDERTVEIKAGDDPLIKNHQL